jgi:hypothetical protein
MARKQEKVLARHLTLDELNKKNQERRKICSSFRTQVW